MRWAGASGQGMNDGAQIRAENFNHHKGVSQNEGGFLENLFHNVRQVRVRGIARPLRGQHDMKALR
jgi:hypothetical protein